MLGVKRRQHEEERREKKKKKEVKWNEQRGLLSFAVVRNHINYTIFCVTSNIRILWSFSFLSLSHLLAFRAHRKNCITNKSVFRVQPTRKGRTHIYWTITVIQGGMSANMLKEVKKKFAILNSFWQSRQQPKCWKIIYL